MKFLSSVVCAILLAVPGFANTIREVHRNAGGYNIFSVHTLLGTIESCHLTNPDGFTMDFIPGEASEYGDRYEVAPIPEDTNLPTCSVTVRDLQESDSGYWEAFFRTTTGNNGTQPFLVHVTGTATQDEDEEDNITWLQPIDMPTRLEQTIDISLPKIDHEEKCTVLPPKPNLIASELETVMVQPSSSFVSCRVTIGPMDDNLLGDWAICGTHTDNGKELKRCQLAKVYWNNERIPGSMWHTNIQPQFEHPVHFGHSITLTVIGQGNIVTCHVITPNGEDLVINENSTYPGLNIHTMENSICSIAIGPIDASMLKEWTVYGIFRSFAGLNEVALPIKMFLYDEDNPYNQSYNVTVPDPVRRLVHLGNTVNIEVENAGQVDSCQFVTPAGSIYDQINHESFKGASFIKDDNNLACKVAVGPITSAFIGDWKVIGKFSNRGIHTEVQQTFQLIEEDPENPTEEDRTISYIREQTVASSLGSRHRIVIDSDIFVTAESCLIRTPDGLQYVLMEGTNIEGIEIIHESGIECGVIVNVISEDVVGEWTLIARATMFTTEIERRLPFTINVEETVEALFDDIIINEGEDLVVRLKNPTDQYESCKLIGPYGFECQSAVADVNHVETCGFIRSNAQAIHSGTWTITFGNRILYKAEIAVTVNTPVVTPVWATLDLVLDSSVSKSVGNENAVYCKLEDPQGFVMFENFGRCNMTLDKVGWEHNGTWTMLVGKPEMVFTEEYHLAVNVKKSESKPVVATYVENQEPMVSFSCSVQTDAEVNVCKFRDPAGRILLASKGVSEDRYQYFGNTSGNGHECGFRITVAEVLDMGLWRCGIETDIETYYGHFSVFTPWLLTRPETADSIQDEISKPILSAGRPSLSVVEDQSVAMSCSIQAVIRYCYFRAANGTTFTVAPGVSSPSTEYIGAGFDAGECGVRFHSLFHADSGQWSCHVGLMEEHEEQRAQIKLSVHERMSVNHYINPMGVMTVEGVVYNNRALEYCRFVRIDGFGFTTDSVPSEYKATGVLNKGECQITARHPTVLDRHPWTIAARVRGQDVEITKDTMDVVIITPPSPEGPGDQPVVVPSQRGLSTFFYAFMMFLLVTILMSAWLGPKKHRTWTYERATTIRRSISRSFRKPPPAPVNTNV